MRKTICIVMAVLFSVTVISGIAEAHVHPGSSGLHTIMAVLFIVSILTHIVVNRKALARYLTTPAKQ